MASSRVPAALLGAGLTLFGAGAGAEDVPLSNPVLKEDGAIAAGRKIYRQRCYICHLSAGGRGPNLIATRLTDEQFLMTVINGRKGATMPAFGLQMSPEEVWTVHAYVKSTDHHE